MKIVFMGSPEISIPFLDFCAGKSNEIIVFTQKDKIRGRGRKLEPTPVKKRAGELGLEVHTLWSKSEKAFEIIKEFSPDILFVVAYGQILPKHILDLPKLYPLNVHFSLLPKYRGSTPVNTALLNGDAVSGTSIMVMDEELDSGDLILSGECAVSENDNATTLFERLTELSLDLLEKNWENIENGNVVCVPQSGEPVFTKMIQKSDMWLDFNDDARKIFNKIRALTYEPGVRAIFRNNILGIEKAGFVEKCSGRAGEIAEVSKSGIVVACRNGGIKITELRPAGKKSMKAAEFINGYKPSAGEIFGSGIENN
ncbi:methionyl-tRNA formyltransferase [bacterium]|nr:methionyl-tRNA formyltransferase [bacterium]